MDGFGEIAVSGAPGVTTALGMGAVFFCLTLLYVLTRAIGRWLPQLLGLARETPPIDFAVHEAKGEAKAVPAARQAPAAPEDGLIAAIVLALARHRSSPRRAAVEGPRDGDAWKIAARIRALRIR